MTKISANQKADSAGPQNGTTARGARATAIAGALLVMCVAVAAIADDSKVENPPAGNSSASQPPQSQANDNRREKSFWRLPRAFRWTNSPEVTQASHNSIVEQPVVEWAIATDQQEDDSSTPADKPASSAPQSSDPDPSRKAEAISQLFTDETAGSPQLQNDQSANQAATDSDNIQAPANKSSWLVPFRWSNREEVEPASHSVPVASKPNRPTRQGRAMPVETSRPSNADSAWSARLARLSKSPFQWSDRQPSQMADMSRQSSSPRVMQRDQGVAWSNPLGWVDEEYREQPQRGRKRNEQPEEDFLTTPPDLRIANAAKRVFEWRNRGPDIDLEAQQLEDSVPNPGTTDEEQIAWEKKRHPWIRPFYWTNTMGLELSRDPVRSPLLDSFPSLVDQPSPNSKPSWMRPFFWSDRQIAVSGPNGALLKHVAPQDRAELAAYFQAQEEMPMPLPPTDGQAGAEDGEDKPGRDEAGGGADKIAEAEQLGEEPEVDNTLQFLRSDTVLLDPGKAQFDIGVVYQLFDTSFIAVNSGSGLELIRFRQRELIVPLEIRYGLTRKIQVFANVPFGWGNTQFTFSELEEFENDGGLGDITFGATILLRQGDRYTSDVILTAFASAPTGNEPFDVIGVAPTPPAIGDGTWSMGASLLWIKTYDPVVVFYGGGTRQHFERQVNGNEFRRGGEWFYRMGVGFAVNERITFSTRFVGSYVSETRINSVRIPGTNQEPMQIEFATTMVQKNRIVEPFINFGLTTDAVDSRLGITWTY